MPQKNEIKQHQQLAEELHRPIIKKCKEEKFILLKDNIWSTDLADMQLISKFNKRNRFLLCVIDIFSKYAWVVPLNDKKGITIVNGFQKILDNSTRKRNRKIVFAERFIRTLKNKIYEYMIAVSKNVYTDKLDDLANE